MRRNVPQDVVVARRVRRQARHVELQGGLEGPRVCSPGRPTAARQPVDDVEEQVELADRPLGFLATPEFVVHEELEEAACGREGCAAARLCQCLSTQEEGEDGGRLDGREDEHAYGLLFDDLVVEANRDKQEEEEEEVVARVDRAPHATARVREVETVPDVVGGQGEELHLK